MKNFHSCIIDLLTGKWARKIFITFHIFASPTLLYKPTVGHTYLLCQKGLAYLPVVVKDKQLFSTNAIKSLLHNLFDSSVNFEDCSSFD